MTNQPLTAEQIAADCKAHQISSEFAIPGASWALYNAIVAYAAQQNAELVAENKKLLRKNEWCMFDNSWIKHEHNTLRAENERLKQQLAWQPIETCPTTGNVLLYAPKVSRGEGRLENQAAIFINQTHMISRPLTHWMPLPQPPKEAT